VSAVYYYDFLRQVHARLAPQAYLEVGIRNGGSLALSRCRSVGIDPAFNIRAELDGDLAVFRTTSDEYFARPDPLAATRGTPFDLAFIDGLHLFEFAFRDFINAERHSSPHGVIIFDDVLPRSVDEAARQRHTVSWTGDVYPMLAVLARYRPDLVVVPVQTQPTGLLVVTGLDPASTTLSDAYDDILAEFRHPDPQPVPDAVLDRLAVVPPELLLQSDLLDVLAAGRGQTSAELRPQISASVGASLGRAFVPASA
jgi:Methyltransferase domain